MTYAVRLRRAAEQDIAKAQAWYEVQRPGLGFEFHEEVSKVLARLAETPHNYALHYGEVRKVVLRTFPYLLWFRIVGDRVQVLAVTDGRQEPNRALARIQ